MKIKLFVYLLILTITNVNLSMADDCNKFDKLNLKEKLIKFKNSKTHKEFTEK